MSDNISGGAAGPGGGYRRAALHRADLAEHWLTQFRAWFAAAAECTGVVEPAAMVLSTAAADGVPSARTVLLKGVDERGLTFFTNATSAKGRDLAANPRAAVVFPWLALERQVVVAGSVAPVSAAESAAYARSRPRGSQLGAWVSHQSAVISSRSVLEDRLRALEERWPGEVPVPPFWGGWRLAPVTVEFWQGRPDRLHDRLRYRRTAPESWVVERLSP